MITFVLMIGAGYILLKLGSSEDEKHGALTKNQWRALAWFLVMLAALGGAILECHIVLG